MSALALTCLKESLFMIRKYSLTASITQAFATQVGDDDANLLAGGDGDDYLIGQGGADTLSGLGGDDLLDGGSGLDLMKGGTGNDSYRVDNRGDTIVELAGQGMDTVVATVSYSLGANLENLVLGGTDSIDATGNVLNNILRGNAGANRLDGGIGIDNMLGGAGDDTYVVDNVGDRIFEDVDGGVDTVMAQMSWRLAATLENLTLLGDGSYTATGNDGDNILTGNNGNNILRGLGGDDVMIGGIGSDSYIVDDAGDMVVEYGDTGRDAVYASFDYTLAENVEALYLVGTAHTGAGNGRDNMLTGNGLDNVLWGMDGNDIVRGGVGHDELRGGRGNDSYVVTSDDTVIEAAGEGSDTVYADFNYTLGANLENLILTGEATTGTGNGLDNQLTGNVIGNTLNGGAGNDELNGGAGVDNMTGGSGNDTYHVDSFSDAVVELADGGIDVVMLAVTSANVGSAYTLADNVENLTVTGETRFFRLTGNKGDNVLTANAEDQALSGLDGNDVLIGGAGKDYMEGGYGNDTYYVDNAGDTILDNFNGGQDVIYSSVSFSLTNNAVETLILTGTENLNSAGNVGDDILIGNSGNNRLQGRFGNDTLTGGAGSDSFRMDLNGGSDVITDFSVAENDRIDLRSFQQSQAVITQDGADAVISLGNDVFVRVLHTTATDPGFLSHLQWT